jgi:flagellar basal body P-ring protein FlgI
MRKVPKKESFQWDEKRKKVVIERTDEIDVKAENTGELEQKLRKELSKIVQRVKGLKARAESIKEVLDKINQAKQNKML